MTCTSPRLRGNLPICETSLRALPEGVRYPGGHVVLLDPDRCLRHIHEDEGCLCHTPHLEWFHSPLGAAVEIIWASADHLLCINETVRRPDLIPHAHPGIAAESHFANGDIAEFVRLIRSSPVAVAHVLSIKHSFTGKASWPRRNTSSAGYLRVTRQISLLRMRCVGTFSLDGTSPPDPGCPKV
jgi:hypothetical protein